MQQLSSADLEDGALKRAQIVRLSLVKFLEPADILVL